MDRNPGTLSRVLAIVLFPFTAAVMVPLLFAFAVLFYLSVLVRAVLQIVAVCVERPSPSTVRPLPQPHFLDVPAAKVVPE